MKKGSFITEDKKGDGNWDHMGFVVKKGSTLTKTSGVKYYDFRVAQHSDDYDNWVSSVENGWETLKKSNPKIVYAIIN